MDARDVERHTYGSDAVWESIASYSRTVRVGPFLAVAGTTAWDEQGNIVGAGDAYTQAAQVLRNIDRALRAAGATLADVVRTRAFVTDISKWEEVARAHGEFFRDIRPAFTLVQVSRLLDPRMLVEIEADAIVADAPIR